MPKQKRVLLSSEEVRAIADRHYQLLRPKLEPGLNGKVILIAVDPQYEGVYVLGTDDIDAHNAFVRLIGKKVQGFGRKIGPDPYTAQV